MSTATPAAGPASATRGAVTVGQYGIDLDGRVITDPSWRCVADVMRGRHGQGERRPVGSLVRWDGAAWVAA